MNKLLTRGGIEIIAVFIGISGGLWSEKQIELKKTLKAEKIALSSIRDEFVSDSTSLSSIVSSIENEQKEISVFLKHISGDTSLSDEKLNSLIFEMIYFAYLTYDKSVYESLIKGAGKKSSKKIQFQVQYLQFMRPHTSTWKMFLICKKI